MAEAIEKTEGSEQEVVADRPRFLSLHAGEHIWSGTYNKQSSEAALAEYEESPTEIKFLCEAADATVVMVYDRLRVEEMAGVDLYTLRNLDEAPISLKDIRERIEKQSSQYEEMLGEYQRHGIRGYGYALRTTREALNRLDLARSIKNLPLEEIRRYITRNEEFGVDTVVEIDQFATTLVAFIDDEAWKRWSNKEYGCSIDGSYNIEKGVMYFPARMKEDPELADFLKHEYWHMADGNVKHLYSDKPLTEAAGGRGAVRDDTLWRLKSEIGSYLWHYELSLGLSEMLDSLKEHLKQGGYDNLLDTPEKVDDYNELFELVKGAIPFVKGLMRECSFDPENAQAQRYFMQSFLTSLPDRRLIFAMLRRVPETGLYQSSV